MTIVLSPERRLRGNLYLVPTLNFMWSFLVVQAVAVPFFHHHGLSITEIFVLQAVFSVTMTVTELPSGYLCDLFGRKNNLVIAGLLKGIGGTLLVLWQDFWGFTVAYVFIGLANSLLSGADIALLYDTHEVRNDDSNAILNSLSRRTQMTHLGVAASSLLGGYAATLDFQWVILLNALFAWLSFVVATGLFEPQKVDPQGISTQIQGHRQNLVDLFRALTSVEGLGCHLLMHSALVGFIAATAQWGLQGYWTHVGIPLVYFGYLWAVKSLVTAYAASRTAKVLKRWGMAGVLIASGFGPTLGFIFAGLWPNAVGVAAGFLCAVGIGLSQVKIRKEFNDNLPAHLRASGNSVIGLMVRLMFFVGGPAIGWLIEQYGYPIVFIGIGLVYGASIAYPSVTLWRRFRLAEGVPLVPQPSVVGSSREK